MDLATALATLFDELDTQEGMSPGDISSATLTRYFNEAEIEACKRWNLISDDSTAEVVQITTADGTRGYDLHPKVLRISRAEYYDSASGYRQVLEQVPYNTIEGNYGDVWRTETGRPTHFAVRHRRLYLYPTPDAAAVVNMEAWRLPLATMAKDNDEPEIPAQHHEDLLHWVKYRVRSRREEELGDPLGASFHLREFERVFGPSVSGQVLTNQLENPPRARFGFGTIR